MDASADRYKSNDNYQSGPIEAVSQTVRNIVRWLVGFFTVTEEDQSKAGIYFGGEERD
jgi:hypothetical protein